MAGEVNRFFSGLARLLCVGQVGFFFFLFVFLLILVAIPIIILLILVSRVLSIFGINLGLGVRLVKWLLGLFMKKKISEAKKSFEGQQGKIIDAEFTVIDNEEDRK